MMLSPVVVGLFWKFMLDVQFGVVNSFLDSLGLGRVEWLTQQRLALLSLIIVDTWQWTPFIMLIALAGLTAVPKYLYEAAEIDRASEWFKFRRITFPLVWPLLLIAVMFRAIEAFRLFDLVYILTGGGPGGTTETLSYNVYKVAFFGFDTGRASAYGILMVIVVTIAAQFYLRYLNKSPGALGWPRTSSPPAWPTRGSRARPRPPPDPPPAASSAAASRSCCSTIFAVVMLFPVVWMLETALKDTERHLRRPGQGHQLRADARALQGRLQRRFARLRRASRTR